MSSVYRPDFQEIFIREKAVEDINEQAFATGLETLLRSWQADLS